MTASYSRRQFVARLLESGTILLNVGITSACTNKESPQENKKTIDPCEDFSGVNETELEKRKKFAYAKQAPDPLKQCNGCKLFLPPKPGEKCGGCLLFKGPVDSNGSCTYWAPLD